MYELFEHTADIGIRIRAASLDELFADAARGLFSVMVANPNAVATSESVPIELSADDLEALLHDWLTELLYVFHARRIVLSEFTVHLTATRLDATVRGELVDVRRHEIDMEVKAVTWHGLQIVQQGDQWLAEVIVDV